MPLTLTSPAFEAGGDIPSIHTCEGDNISPPLNWTGVPAGTKSLALIIEDPDAPDPAAPQRIFTHWVLYDIPPTATGLAPGVESKLLPPGTREGYNDWKRAAYGGPCPPVGRHRYFHRLYALDMEFPDLGAASRVELLQAIHGHILEQAELIGHYQKKKGQ